MDYTAFEIFGTAKDDIERIKRSMTNLTNREQSTLGDHFFYLSAEGDLDTIIFEVSKSQKKIKASYAKDRKYSHLLTKSF